MDSPLTGAERIRSMIRGSFGADTVPAELADGSVVNLTRYTLGKFTLNVDEVAHSFALSGFSDEFVGDCDALGWAADLVTGSEKITDEEIDDLGIDELTQDDRAYIKDHTSMIVYYDDQGFVSVDWYRTQDDARTRWAELVKAEQDEYAEQEQEEQEPLA